MSALDYVIVVPSRKRAHNMPIIRSLLPTAFVCVNEDERAEYAPFVPSDKLVLHPHMRGLAPVYNWALEHFKNKILIEVDDDFCKVKCLVGSRRTITEPREILAILENAARCCQDLGLSTFSFARTANYLMLPVNTKPIQPVAPVCNAFGVMNAARHRRYNPDYLGRGDVDWTLQTLLEDRCVYADLRFYFDCGKVFGGRGGNVGLVTKQQFERTSYKLRAKWGRYVSYKAPAFARNRSVAAIRIAVSRRNPTAQK